ncbi:dodecin family protein [Bradyrhizobium sp. SZCCHNR2035]|uniref:dodecin family protein n=1 Tax=Bradyrhizobium sp. SZCCHNR2035 TaxID=3057386 RepID=UPI002917051C|nr:dodecin family protein [Bradyrhizobium sp. SZCCHNR2035]
MPDSVYKVIELIGTSRESWEKAAANAVEQAAKTLRDLRVAEVVQLDMQLDARGKVESYRAKLNVSFKFEGS